MKKKKVIILVAVFISVIVILIRLLILFFGGKETIIVCSFKTIDDAFKNILIPLFGIGVTAILSYMIWEANSKSALVAEKMQNQERELERERIVISASKLFFSMLSSYEYLIFHYNNESNIRTVFLCNDWLDELSKLKKIFTYKEIQSIFDLFRDISTLTSLEKKFSFQKTLDDYCRYRLLYFLKDYDFMVNFDIAAYVKRDDWLVMHKLSKLSQINSMEEIEDIKNEKYTLIFKQDYKNGQKKYEIEYINNCEYKIQVYRNDGQILVDGFVKNNRFNGYKENYEEKKLVAKGTYVDGLLFNGEKYHVYAAAPEYFDEIIEEYFSCPVEPYYKVQSIIDGVIVENNAPDNIEYI